MAIDASADLKVFVTGGSGFVGSAVIRALVRRGVRVKAMVRQEGVPRNLRGLDLELWRGDLGDEAALARALRGLDGLFHVAADYRLWALHPQELYETNVEGSKRLMRAARKADIPRIVYTSSVATLGAAADGEDGDEQTPVSFSDMIGDYKKSKFLAEEAVRAMAVRDNLPVVVVNPSAPVGPGDARPTPTGRMVVQAARGRMPFYVESGLNIVHVDDVAEGHILAFDKGRVGERYILGGDNMNLKEIISEAARLNGARPPLCALPSWLLLPLARLVETLARWRRARDAPLLTVTGVKLARKRMFFSSARAMRALGYAPRPAARALGDAVAWFRQHGYLGGGDGKRPGPAGSP